LINEIPESKRVFTGKNVLSDTHSWTDIVGKLYLVYEVFSPDPKCHGKLSIAAIASLDLDYK